MSLRRPIAAALLLTASMAACGEPDPAPREEAPLLAFDTARVRVVGATDTVELRVELATDDDRRAVGLMERSHLPADAGMLFVYPGVRPPDAGFWMFHTRIPLDIAFLDDEGRIVGIRSMEPCASPDARWCDSYSPGAPYRAALEANLGFFAEHAVQVGDRVLLPDGRLPAAR